MLRILLRVGQEGACVGFVLPAVSRAAGGASNGVDDGLPSLDAAMRLRRGAEQAEAAEVEIKQVGRRVDAAQGAIQLEVIAHVALLEAARQDHLEDVAPQAVCNAPADVGLVLFVGQGRGDRAGGAEVVDAVVAVVDGALHAVQAAGLAFRLHLQQEQFAVVVVEDDDILIYDV